MTPQDKISDEELERMALDYYQFGPDQYNTSIKNISDNAFKAGYRAAQTSKPEWPSDEEIELGSKETPFEFIPNSDEYKAGFESAFEWLKQKLTPSQGKGSV